MAKKKVNTQPFWRFIFLIYLAGMLYLLFGRSWGWVEGIRYQELVLQSISLKPFRTIDNYMYVVLHRQDSDIFVHCLVNLVGNVVLFIPAGWLLPRLFRRFQKFFPFFFSAVGIILLIETADSVEVGELGIFILDGDGYFKIYGGDCLISLNPEYGKIMLKDFDEVACIGKVRGKLKKK